MKSAVSGSKPFFILALAVVIGIAFLANLKWLAGHRFGMLLDIDEAGYLSYAMAFARALKGGGIFGWLSAISMPMATGPLTPVTASVLMRLFGMSDSVGMVTNALLSALLILPVYGLASRLSDRTTGLLAAVLVATTPMIVEFSRNFQFAMAATLFFTAAVYFHCRSNAFEVRWASIMVGVSLGLMCLSRTMMVAFVPVFVTVFLAYGLLVTGLDRTRRVHILLAILAACVVAGPWYIKNFNSVFGYLFSFGYGAAASEYGADRGIFTLANLQARLDSLLVAFRPLHFLIVFPFFFAGLFLSGYKRLRSDRDPTVSFILFYALLVVGGLFILATTRNRGTGFVLPFLPVMTVLATVTLSRILEITGVRPVAFAGIGAVALFLGYASIDRNLCVALPRGVVVPGIGNGPMLDCQDPITGYITSNGVEGLVKQGPGEETEDSEFDRDVAKAWRQVSAQVAQELQRLVPKHDRAIAFASRHVLMNVNTVGLEEMKQFGAIWPARQIEPNLMENTEAGYRQWIESGKRPENCLVLLLTDNRGEFTPRPHTAEMTKALTSLNYSVVRTIPTPTPGQSVNLWASNSPTCR